MNMKDLRIRSGKRVEDIASQLPAAISSVRAWEQMLYMPKGTPLWMARIAKVYGCTFEELCKAERSCNKARKKAKEQASSLTPD